jgi:beta-glucanase (GH16 family)
MAQASLLGADAPASPWTLVFADEFDGPDGSAPDTSAWDYEVGYIRNNEMQWYRNSTDNAFQQNGSLRIVARAQPAMVPEPGNTNGQERLVPVTSASLFTKQTFTYGKIEARLKVPSGVGVWPAFWMLGDFDRWGWPMCGEIDIMEYVGYDPKQTHSSLHCEARNSLRNNQPTVVVSDPDMAADFETYSAEWSPENVTLLVSGRPVLTYRNDDKCSQVSWPYHLPFAVKLNLAIGGSWGGLQGVSPTIFPAVYEIDYVRVYEHTVPPPLPACDMQRRYVILKTDQAYVNLPGMSALTADIQSTADAHAEFITAVGGVMGLSAGAAATAIAIDAMAPFRNATDNLVHLLFNVTVHGVAQAALTNLSDVAAVNASLARLRGQLSSWIFKSGNWDVVVSGATCPDGCWTVNAAGDAVPKPLPFQDFGLPASIPFRTYDYGGQGVGYSDTTTWNQYMTNTFRSGFDGVDIGPDNSVGYAVPGEFLRFGSVRVPACAPNATRRTFDLFVSAGNANGSPGIVSFEFEGVAPHFDRVSGSVAVLPTGSWAAVEGTPGTPVALGCDRTYAVTVTFPQSNYNLDSFSLR